MSETVKSFARMYGVSLDEALNALEKNNIIVLSADIEIAEEKLPRYSKVLAELKEAGGNPEPVKKKTLWKSSGKQQKAISSRTRLQHKEQKGLSKTPSLEESSIQVIVKARKV